MTKKTNVIRIFISVSMALAIILVVTLEASAYVKLGYKLDTKSTTKIYIAQKLIDEGNKTRIINCAKTWDYSGSPMSFAYQRPYRTSDYGKANTIIFTRNYIRNGAYAVNYHYSNRPGSFSNIVIYKDYYGATSAQKNEILVHEIGHSVGLAHCQTSKRAAAVMRATGFNGKAYPLSDDKAGVRSIY